MTANRIARIVFCLLLMFAASAGAEIIPVNVQVPTGMTAGQYPATFGVPMPRGSMAPDDPAIIFADGKPLTTQTDVLATWDKQQQQVRWLLVDFQVDPTNIAAKYELRTGDDAKIKTALNELLHEADDKLVINTGKRKFVISRSGPFGFDGTRFITTDHNGITYTAHADNILIEDKGSNRVTLKSEGWYIADDGTKFCKHNIRLSFFANSSKVQVLHTWIFTGTSDSHQIKTIAMHIPAKGDAVTFGSESLEPEKTHTTNSQNVALIQHYNNRFDLKYELTDRATGKTIATGKKWAGWCDVSNKQSGVTAALRDAWQNYPSAMAFADGKLKVEFWPEEFHAMDFRAPAMLRPYGDKGIETIRKFFLSKRDPYTREIFEIYNNAMGLAKTHEVWLDFHDGQTTKSRADSLVTQTKSPILAMASPKWNCASGALGPFHPRDEKTYPEAEAALDAMFDRFINWRDHFADFGWHDYGDIHCSVRSMDFGHEVEGGKCAPLWRYWDSTHYGYPNTPWMLYFRSGERKYLQWAQSNARHCMDIDICHHGDGEDRITGSHYYCNWSIVPWYGKPPTYVRIADYNKYEYLLYAYYMTGYRRAFDVLQEYGQAMSRYHDDESVEFGLRILRSEYRNVRHFGPPLGNMTELYRATWDERYLDIARDYAQALIDMYPEDDAEFVRYMGKLRFCWQGMANYARLTGDETFKKSMLRYAQNVIEHGGDVNYSDLGYGYEFAPNEEWLTAGKMRMMQMLANVNTSDDFQSRGSAGTWVAGHYPYTMRSLPVFMHAMSNAPESWQRANLPLNPTNRSAHLAGPQLSPMYVMPSPGAKVKLRLTKDQQANVIDATGKTVQQLSSSTIYKVQTVQFASDQPHMIQFPVNPTRHAGDYIVRGNIDLVDVTNAKLVLGPSTDDGKFCVFGLQYYFLVPEDVETFTIEVDTSKTWALFDWNPTVHIYDSNGNVAASKTGDGNLKFEITAKPEQRGKLWSLGPLGRVSAPKWPGGKKAEPFDMPFPAYFKLSANLPQYVATHPDLFALPE